MRGNFITDRRGSLNPNYKDGRKGTRLYRIWRNIKTRCLNTNNPSYKRYGGRGITVCNEWQNNFQAFKEWALSHGYAENLTIDRINNDGNYEPDNCRWITMKKQSMNTSRSHFVQIGDEIKTLIEWCDVYKIKYPTVCDRLHRGWDEVKALTSPVQTKFRKKVV